MSGKEETKIFGNLKRQPQATRTVIVAITPNNTAPSIENINQYSPYHRIQEFLLHILIYFAQHSCNITTYSCQVL